MLGGWSVAVPALALVVAAGLSGCGSDDTKAERKQPKPSASATVTTSAPAAYLEVPDGVTLTEPGTDLALGEKGVVAFERRQDVVGVLAVTVERVERTSFQESFPGWQIDDSVAARTPYFVRVEVTNDGDVDLGGMSFESVLWANDGSTLEAPNTYSAKGLPACSGGALPTPFGPGETANLCEVYYIAPGQPLENILFQPFGGLEPITWSGKVSKVSDPTKKSAGKKTGNTGKKTGKKR